jgi:hypothetical protein
MCSPKLQLDKSAKISMILCRLPHSSQVLYESIFVSWQGLNPACRAQLELFLQTMVQLFVWLAHWDFTVHLWKPETAHHAGLEQQGHAMQ